MDLLTGTLFLVAGLVMLALFFMIFVALKKAAKFLLRIIVNSVLGLLAIFILGFFGISVPITLPTVLIVAIFGLGGLGVLLILMFFGVKL